MLEIKIKEGRNFLPKIPAQGGRILQLRGAPFELGMVLLLYYNMHWTRSHGACAPDLYKKPWCMHTHLGQEAMVHAHQTCARSHGACAPYMVHAHPMVHGNLLGLWHHPMCQNNYACYYFN